MLRGFANYLSVAIPLRVIAVASSSLTACRFQLHVRVEQGSLYEWVLNDLSMPLESNRFIRLNVVEE